MHLVLATTFSPLVPTFSYRLVGRSPHKEGSVLWLSCALHFIQVSAQVSTLQRVLPWPPYLKCPSPCLTSHSFPLPYFTFLHRTPTSASPSDSKCLPPLQTLSSLEDTVCFDRGCILSVQKNAWHIVGARKIVVKWRNHSVNQRNHCRLVTWTAADINLLLSPIYLNVLKVTFFLCLYFWCANPGPGQCSR